MNKKLYDIFKLITKSLLKIILFWISVELIFGSYFKNFNKFKLNDERNVLRVYNLKIENYSNISTYYRDNNAFRTNKKKKNNLENIETIFLGGSTANQRYLNYEETIVNFLNLQAKKEKFLHAALDGISVIGFINSFDLWFDENKKLKPKKIIIFFEPEDYNNLILEKNKKSKKCSFKKRHLDYFEQSSLRENLHWFLEANSIWVYLARRIKDYVYFKFNLDIGVKNVGLNLKTKFSGPRKEASNYLKIFKEAKIDEVLLDKKFYDELYRTYWNIRDYEYTNRFVFCYQNKLNELINLTRQKKITPIFISPINGGKSDFQVILMNRILKKFSSENNIKYIDLFNNLYLSNDNFFSYSDLTVKGSEKVSKFIFRELKF